jgi:hypothetical protein
VRVSLDYASLAEGGTIWKVTQPKQSYRIGRAIELLSIHIS